MVPDTFFDDLEHYFWKWKGFEVFWDSNDGENSSLGCKENYWWSRDVGIKGLLDAAGIADVHVCVNTAQLELVLLVDFSEKYAKCLLLMMDYTLWEVIENGATLPKKQIVEGVTIVMPITTVEEKAQRRLEVKAISTLMMGIPNEHQLKFNSIKDAKQLLKAIEKRFGDVNQKLLRSLSPEWNTNAVVWRNKVDLDTISMDDLYKNLKVYEPEVKGMSSSSSSTQNMAFVSSLNNNSSNTNGPVNTAQPVNTVNRVSTASTQVNAAFSKNIDNLSDAVICSFFASKPSSPQLVHEDLEQIYPDGIEEMDLRWYKESTRRSVPVEITTYKALVSCNGRGRYDWSDQTEEGPNYALMAFTSSSFDSNVSNDSNCSKSCLETINHLKSQNEKLLKDLNKYTLTVLDEFAIKPIAENTKSSKEETKAVRKNNDASMIKEWVLDDEEENVDKNFNTARPKVVVSAVKRNNLNVVKASSCWVWKSKTKVLDHVSEHNSASITLKKFDYIDAQGRSKTPTLSFVRPFGCPVTILNTLDQLGKFDGKVDEGFFVGYSLNSKAFRVFNSRTRIIEENLYIRFSEITPNIVVNAAGTNEDNELPFDPNIPALEDVSTFNFSSDDKDNGAMADMTNLVTTIQVSPNPTTRIHKDHPLDQVIRDLHSATQTRQMSKNLEEHEFVSTIQQRSNYKDLQNCLFACFLSQEEPKKDEREIVIRNKARLVAQGHTQEEGIDNDKVFIGVARIEAIRLFLAYASFKGFVVYQMDVKSAFLYGKIKEEVYVCQPPGFKDPDFPDRVYKVEKALYGLHQAPKAWFTKVKNASTPMETQKILLKDEDEEEVDVHMYRYQVNLKVSHLHAVKRIFSMRNKQWLQIPQQKLNM
nr:retrovirus-related Pol polyprotein from transposon TNT 1-94 [Tanacetum cinerariifolium]